MIRERKEWRGKARTLKKRGKINKSKGVNHARQKGIKGKEDKGKG